MLAAVQRILRLLIWTIALFAVSAQSSDAPDNRVAKLSSVGSDTLSGMMRSWVSLYSTQYPDVVVQVQSSGSSTAPVAMLEGAASIGPMSRPMTPSERLAFQNKYGYPITEIIVGVDAVSVFVHIDNPLESLSLPQLDAIFSSTRRCGGESRPELWGDLGVVGSVSTQSLSLFGRNSVSGTYTFFRRQALCGGDFASNVSEQPGSSSVVQSVAVSLRGIGYTGVGFLSSGVKPLALRRHDGAPAVLPTEETAISGQYPLARPLYLYVNQPKGKAITGLERDFIRVVLSDSGQEVVSKSGFVALPLSHRLQVKAELGVL